MATHAEVVAQTLAAHGVEYLFGLPGGEIVAFMDACRRAGIRFLLTGHEASAAWMAQTVGQITGVPGVCASTLGPGATNLVTGVANALLERAPMLAVTAQIPGAALATMTHQRLALNELFAPITKRSVTLGEGDTGQIADCCMRLAAAPRPGPVHIAIPSDVAIEECSYSARIPEKGRDEAKGLDKLAEISARINEAERPLVLIGLGATPSCAPAVREFVRKLGAPFLVTPKAKGILSEDDPLFLGVATGMAIDRDIVETVHCADLVIGIGFDPVECDKTWFAEVPIVSIDDATMSEGSYHPHEVIGSIPLLLESLAVVAKPWPDQLVKHRRQAATRVPESPENGLSPLRAIEILRSVFPRAGIVTCDVGSHKLIMGQFWRSYEPGTFFMSNGLSGMGFGVPTAVAAQLVYKDRPVMAVVGDGGMLMMAHDLVLIRELQLPIVIVVFSDRSLSLIRVSQERRGFSPYGVDFAPPDFAALAEAFGVRGTRAESLGQVTAAVESALSERRPAVIEVPVDFREYYNLV